MMTPLWTSGFRPFFLLGAAYGPFIILMWMPAAGGPFGIATPPLWHGHEMLFGFAAAFICGFVLTALPSWARAPEIRGRPLKLLVMLWLAGRAGSWFGATWPLLGGALDLLLFVSLAALVLPGLVRVVDKRYVALLPILFGLVLADCMYYAALWRGDLRAAEHALLLAVNVLTVLFAVVGGLLTPIFTETALREAGMPFRFRFLPALEVSAVASAVLFAAADWIVVPPRINGAIAVTAAAVHLVRFARWQLRRMWTMPMILSMHIAYAWLVAAMALRGAADLFGLVPRPIWIHAFTVGALGMMMLSFLNRVTLRHTGRALKLSRYAQAGLAIMFAGGVVRVGASLFDAGPGWIATAGWLWAAPFALFLCTDGPKLWRPSLPRAQAAAAPMLNE
jgi:uncharacterized protein involved in response to NO